MLLCELHLLDLTSLSELLLSAQIFLERDLHLAFQAAPGLRCVHQRAGVWGTPLTPLPLSSESWVTGAVAAVLWVASSSRH